MSLINAVFDRDVETLRDRIAQGGNVDETTRGGVTPLMCACILGFLEGAQALIDAGAAVNTLDNGGWPALFSACFWGHHGCVQALTDAGASVDMVDDEEGRTALMLACINGHLECAKLLMDAGAAVDMVDNDGSTALMGACFQGHVACAQALIDECTRALVDEQAVLELTNRDGQNALMIACESPPSHCTQSQRQGRIRCALALLAARAPIQGADFPDWAALLKFAGERFQQIEVVLASPHVIEDAPHLARVGALKADAQDVFAHFARGMLARAKRG